MLVGMVIGAPLSQGSIQVPGLNAAVVFDPLTR